jgi:hypothetical protein
LQEKRLTTEQEAANAGKVHRKWISVLEQIRSLDSFHDFLLPASFDTLQKAAAYGPIVILNASDSSCDALIMISVDIIHVPLPRCTLVNLTELVKLVQRACMPGFVPIAKSKIQAVTKTFRDFPESSREDRYGRIACSTGANADDIFREVLAILWESVVEPIFTLMNLKVSEQLCPKVPGFILFIEN